MGWLENAFAETSVAWLLISTIVASFIGVLSSWLTYRYVKRQEIVDQVLADIEKERALRREEELADQQERLRQEVVKWANPILSAVRALMYRLQNILEGRQVGYLALSKSYKRSIDPQWSITYEYFFESTLYLFAEYFAWIRMFEEELSFEMFRSHAKKDEFMEAIRIVSKALSSFPPKTYDCSGPDTQVFNLQQRSIAELMIVRSDSGSRSCLSYPEFANRMNDQKFSDYFEPLVKLLDELTPDDDCRWKRLTATYVALMALVERCEQLLVL